MKQWIFLSFVLLASPSIFAKASSTKKASTHATLDLLSYEQFTNLSYEDQRAYLRGLRDILVQLEKINPKAVAAAVHSPLFAQLFEAMQSEAVAQSPGTNPDPISQLVDTTNNSNPPDKPGRQGRHSKNPSSSNSSNGSNPSSTSDPSNNSGTFSGDPHSVVLPPGVTVNPAEKDAIDRTGRSIDFAKAYSAEVAALNKPGINLNRLSPNDVDEIEFKQRQAISWAVKAYGDLQQQTYQNPQMKQIQQQELKDIINTISSNDTVVKGVYRSTGSDMEVLKAAQQSSTPVQPPLPPYAYQGVTIHYSDTNPVRMPPVAEETEPPDSPAPPKKPNHKKSHVYAAPAPTDPPPVKTSKVTAPAAQSTDPTNAVPHEIIQTGSAAGVEAPPPEVGVKRQQAAPKAQTQAQAAPPAAPGAAAAPPKVVAKNAQPAAGGGGSPIYDRDNGPATPQKPTNAQPSTGFRCVYAGFFVQGTDCTGKTTLPDNVKFLDPNTFKCAANKFICNPIIFGFDSEDSKCDFTKDLSPTDPCVKNAKPFCTSGATATADCKKKSDNSKGFDTAMWLDAHDHDKKNGPNNLAAYNEFRTAFEAICRNKDYKQISYGGDGVTAAQQKANLNDIAKTCDTLITQWNLINTKFKPPKTANDMPGNNDHFNGKLGPEGYAPASGQH